MVIGYEVGRRFCEAIKTCWEGSGLDCDWYLTGSWMFELEIIDLRMCMLVAI